MAEQVTLPDLGDGIESGDVLEIFVSEGDTITKGQDIVELETDKATVPVPASIGGKVVKVCISEGETVPVGAVLLEVEATEGAGSGKSEPPKQEAPAKQDAPAESKSTDKEKPAQQASASPSPSATAPAAERSASAAAQPAAQGQPAAEQPIITREPTTQHPQQSPARLADPLPSQIPGTGLPVNSSGVIPAGPAIRRFAREVGVELSNVRGTGEGGRITRDDVLAVVRSASQGRSSSGAAAGATTTAPSVAAPTKHPAEALPGTADQDEYGPIRVERLSKIRKTIAAQMHQSWSTVPRVTNFDDADITDLEQLRQSSKDDYAAQGLKLTTMPFLIKAIATALKHTPEVNAVIDEENGQLIYKDYVNIGIAVDTDRGLVVPVMKNADRMGIPDIARSLAEMSAKVRSGQFAVSDLRGGTFTISNLGAIGGQYSTPIVNVPEVAILLVGRSRKIPCVMPDDSIKPRLTMPLSLSYDHRLVDGGTAARFLNDVISYLEAPSRLLLAL
ncbi:MAG: 2-oxo acid dehydrogenase subunit E2 [Pirellulaceae bacterium]